jgi:hypothetical protein
VHTSKSVFFATGLTNFLELRKVEVQLPRTRLPRTSMKIEDQVAKDP